MNNCDHNKIKFRIKGKPRPPGVKTLGDLREEVSQLDLKDTEKAQLRSAIKRTDELVGHGLLDLPAEPKAILARLEALSPAMAGMSKQAFANLKSRTRHAFRLVDKQLAPARSHARLQGEYLDFEDTLSERDKRHLSRFLRYGYTRDWQLSEITDDHIEEFATYLHETALIQDWDYVVRSTIRAWNRVAKQSDRGINGVSPSRSMRTRYWVEDDVLPAEFIKERDDFLSSLSGSNTLLSSSSPALRPKTIEQYGYVIRTLVSAQIASGIDPSTFTSLSALLLPTRVMVALEFLYERAEKQPTSTMLTIAIRARRIAEHCGLDGEQIKTLDECVCWLKDKAPKKRGLTDKNIELLSRLDDQRAVDLISLLPMTLMERAGKCKNVSHGIANARAAMAIEILLVTGMRRANLVSLELGKTIRKIGSGKQARWIIELQAEEVKNKEPLRFELPEDSAELLELYLKVWRPQMCVTPTTWLFPRKNGEHIGGPSMHDCVSKKTKRELGFAITPHQFRHTSAELYLRENPEGLSIVSLHLGHRDLNTTRHFYARSKQKEASQRYQEHMLSQRTDADRRRMAKVRFRRESQREENHPKGPEPDYL